MVRLDSTTGQSLLELEALKTDVEKQSSEMEVLKVHMTSQLAANSSQMVKVLKTLQQLRSKKPPKGPPPDNNGREIAGHRSNNRLTKMDFPKFFGTNVEG